MGPKSHLMYIALSCLISVEHVKGCFFQKAEKRGFCHDFRFLECVFIMLIDVKMPIIVRTLTLVGMVNLILGWVEYKMGYVVFIMPLNVKMSIVVGIITFMSMMNFVLSWGDHNGTSYWLNTFIGGITKPWEAISTCWYFLPRCDVILF